eukprot:TRINITY_DN1788_c0_g1_i2.p1 TRINITY_DN1788_c0_g1~~TRINITY_DN1788_c0_g1_i2.p1  ORF type:complete len:488 (-),score=101.57 TRINITY_DN1788_c0_g1_i2:262-1725(-)
MFKQAAKIEGSENDVYLPAFKKILRVMANSLDAQKQTPNSSAEKQQEQEEGERKEETLAQRAEPSSDYTALHVDDHIIIDTHSHNYLLDKAPDISVCAQHTSEAAVDAFLVLSAVELQKRRLDNTHRGKALNYIERLMHANPQRTHAMCLVTDLKSFEVYKGVRSDERIIFAKSATSAAATAWPHILEFMCLTAQQAGWKNLEVELQDGKFTASGLLEPTPSVEVYCGTWTRPDGRCETQQVCKKYIPDPKRRNPRQGWQREVDALTRISVASPPALFPTLVASSKEELVVITSGLGTTSDEITPPMVTQLLRGLSFLHHTVGLVHNDIEPRHILRIGSSDAVKALLIDYNTCREVGAEPEPRCLYNGTLFYAADDVLCQLASNQPVCPAPRHDLVALVKSIYVMRSSPAVQGRAAAAVERVRGVEGNAGKVLEVRKFWDHHPSSTSAWRGVIASAHQTAADAEGVAGDQLASSYTAIATDVIRLLD